MNTDDLRADFFTFRRALSRSNIPLSISCELTYRCQLNCKHCYIDRNSSRAQEMSPAQWTTIFREAAELGDMNLLLTGGEPTLYPAFWELLEELGNDGFFIRLFTNAYDYNEEKVERLVQANVRFIEVSLHGADARTQDAFSGVPGSFERIIRSLRLFREAGLFVKIKTSLLKENYRQHNRLERLAHNLGGTYVSTGYITPTNRGEQPVADCYLSVDETAWVEGQRAVPRGAETRAHALEPVRRAVPCNAGLSTFAVSPNGDISPCIQTPLVLGKAAFQSVARIWQHSSRLMYWRGIAKLVHPTCRDCRFAIQCSRCSGIAFLETGSAWKPSPTVCSQAKKNLQLHQILSARADS